MKLRTHTNTHESTHKAEISDFSIKANAKAFDTLLSGLYANKVKAVIRELWTNAYDSHVDAGIPDTPFDVHLPNRFEPTFRVRDYGVSLSHDDVVGLYTTLFDSTKTATNDVVGALGLGSKSPFAYTDQFTVIARLDGRKRTYLAARQTDGTPGISLVSDVESDEAQGLEVSIAVEQSDFAEFEREAQTVAIGFSPVPDVDGIELDAPEPVWMSEDGQYAIYPRQQIGGRGLAIRQGCVIYPVDRYGIAPLAENHIQYGYTLVADVPIGVLSFTAGREGVSYDDETVEVIKQADKAAAAALRKEIEAKAEHCNTLLEAQEFWFGGGSKDGLSTATSFEPRWKGEVVPNYINFDISEDHKRRGQSSDHLLTVKQGNGRDNVLLRQIPFNRRNEFRLVVFRSDEKVKRAALRYRGYVKLRGRHSVYRTLDPTPKQLERYMRLAGLNPDQIINVSSIPDPGPPQRDASGRPTEKGMKAGVNQITGYGSWVKVAELPDNYVGFEVERTTTNTVEEVWQNYGYLQRMGLIPNGTPCYAFTPRARERHADPDKMAEARKRATVEKYREAAVEQETAKLFNARLSGAGLADFVEKMEVSDARIPEGVKIAVSNEVYSRVDEAIEAVEVKYPLLFDEPNEAAIKWYVDARNKELD